MKKLVRLSPFIKDIGLTAITSAITAISVIITIRLLSQCLGPDGLGAYSLSRRFLAIVSPFSTLAMGMTLARYVAITPDSRSRDGYLLGGLILGVVPSFMVLIIGLAFTRELSSLVFHSKAYTELFVATLFLVVGYSFYDILYGYYRGSGNIARANAWQIALMSVGPVIIVLAYAKLGRVDYIVFLFGALFSISLLPLALYSFRALTQRKKSLHVSSHMKDLLKYGLPRVPAGLALAGIFSIGPFFAPYFGSLKEAGYLVIGQSVFSVMESGVVAFGIVVLPKVAQLFADGRNDFLKDRVVDIVAFIIHLGLFAMLHLLLWSDKVILVWLGARYADAIPITKIFLLALIPYLSYVMLRSVLDAIEEKAVNAHNLYISFTVTLVVSLLLAFVGLGAMGLATGVTVGFFTLGALTLYNVMRLYRFGNADAFKLKECLLLNALFFTLAFSFRYLLVSMTGGITLLALAVFVEVILCALYCIALWMIDIRWIDELEHRVLRSVA